MPPDRITRARWLAARTRNAARHGLLIGAVSSLVTLIAMLTFVLVPRQVDRAMASALGTLPAPLDTQALLATRRAATTTRDSVQARIDSARAMARRALDEESAWPGAGGIAGREVSAALPSGTTAADTADAAQQLALENALGRALERARQAPLVESYRALVLETVLQRDPRARATLDTIEQVHREREAYAALGGPDARYAALTTRLTGLGDRLLAIGAQYPRSRRAAVAPSAGSEETVGSRGDIATDPAVAQTLRDATAAAHRADSALDAARLFNRDVAAAREVVRDRFSLTIPPVAALLASLVLGVSAGFGTALWREMRRPTVGDALELEALTGARVIEHRAASDAWPLLHLSLTHIGDVSRVVEILGDQPLITATVAMNLATVAARESRETALVDLAERGGALRALLPAASLQRAEATAALYWDTTRAIALESDTAVDLVRARSAPPVHRRREIEAARTAAGGISGGSPGDAGHEELEAVLAPYDFAVIVSGGQRGAMPSLAAPDAADVVLCARLGVTPLAWLDRAQRYVRDRGRRVRAVVLWTGAPPLVG